MPYQYMPGYQPYYQPPMADQLAQLRGAQYQPIPQQIPQVQPQQAQTGGQSMVWVSGEAEAMAYLVAPNSAVALWDSNAPTIYLKQADASGKPSIKVYDLVERTQKPVQASQPSVVEYAPLSRVEALEARLNELTVVKEMPVRTTKKTTTKEDAE
jgi:succinylarginine dihydrolase